MRDEATKAPSIVAKVLFFFSQVLEVCIPLKPYDRKFKFATVCTGADSPMHALVHLLGGSDEIDYIFGCDVWPVARNFTEANYAPNHMFLDVKDLLSSKAPCTSCKGECMAAMQEDIDLLVGGFPCKAFSALDPQRWDGRDIWKDPRARPFLHISTYLRTRAEAGRPVRAFILVNVSNGIN